MPLNNVGGNFHMYGENIQRRGMIIESLFFISSILDINR